MKNNKFKQITQLAFMCIFMLSVNTTQSEDPFGNPTTMQNSQMPPSNSQDNNTNRTGLKASENKATGKQENKATVKEENNTFQQGGNQEEDHETKKKNYCWPLSICGIHCPDCTWYIIWGLNLAALGALITSIAMNAHATGPSVDIINQYRN